MRFVVAGAGAWGTAFAVHLARLGHAVVLVPRRPEQARALAAARENAEYLPGVALPAGVELAGDLTAAAAGATAVLLACPAQALRETAALAGSAPWIISLAKGLEAGTHARPSEVIAAARPGARVAALSGPTNALGVARADPSAMVLAADRCDPELTALQTALSGPALRVYASEDLPGVEYGGCLKNIYAIAAGCCDGLRLGDNTKAALLTRALAEMVRVGGALGARTETFCGLSGFGDLVATCYGGWSRNREFGQRIGEGRPVAELLAGRRTVVEGYRTTEAFAALVRERGIEAPILTETHALLFTGKPPAAALDSLMRRGLRRE